MYSTTSPARLRWLLAGACSAALACTEPPESRATATLTEPTAAASISAAPSTLRVWDDPYADVRWQTDQRLLMQTHDHAATTTRALLAYDSAGYQLMPLMDYSGVASLPHARRRRLWPADSVVTATVRAGIRNIRTWLPAAEEIGHEHLVSLFLTDYIAKWEPTQYPAREPWMYASGQEAVDLIQARGGFAILAHPWGPPQWTAGVRGYRGIEMYSAFAEQRRVQGTDPFFTSTDRNRDLLNAWDRALLTGELVVGFAVNDHFGPDRRDSTLSPRVRDSGKSLVLARDASLAAVREAVEAGRVFAIRDFSVPKRRFLPIDSAGFRNQAIFVATAGTVRWIVDGRLFTEGPKSLSMQNLPATARFVRAEVDSPDGSVVYTQAFRLRPRGDVDGDGLVTARDAELCRNPSAPGTSTRTLRACLARARTRTN